MQLREAADVLGVHYQTAYGWVRQGVLPARKTARGYEVSLTDVSALAERRATGIAPSPQIRVRDWTAQVDRLHAAIVSGDETTARQVFARLARGVSIAELCDRFIAPALNRIGASWAAGDTRIAIEHRATAICERLISARTRQPQGRPRGIAVTAAPPGERHTLPVLMATACLREDRWLVHHLAADVPVAEVVSLATDTEATLVVLYFMHARYSPKRTQLVIICAVFWLAIMLALTLSDYVTRDHDVAANTSMLQMLDS